MTIAATTLRLAAIEAMVPTAMLTAASPAWPTLAGPQVADNQLYLWNRTTVDRSAVAVSVSVDEIRGMERGESYGLARQDIDVTLIFDVEIGVVDGSDETATGATPAIAAAKLEATVAQIRYVLTLGPTGRLFRRMTKSIPRLSARATRDPDSAVPLMRQTLSLTVTIDDDDWTDVVDGLPAPSHELRAGFPADSYGLGILDAIADLWIAPDDPTPLETVVWGVDLDGTAPASIEAAAVAGSVTLT